MCVSLAQIEAEWAQYKPAGQRPLAGRRALAGFNFQLSLSLAAFFDGVFRQDPLATQAFEGLSDVAELRDGLLYVTQVKLTLSTVRLKEAYREFLLVDRFLEERFPETREIVRFQVFCRAIRSQVQQDLDAAALGLDSRDAVRWQELRNRVLPFEVRGDPSLELVLKLWGRVARPFSLVSRFRGLLLERLAENATSASIARDLLGLLEREQVEKPPPGRILSVADFVDRSAGHTDVLIGQRPTPEDLARGCFMEREDRLRPVLEEIQAAIANMAASGAEPRKLPIVWIAGGSGTGKSVLLLQATTHLVTQADVVLHSLHHLVGLLPEALDYWRQQAVGAVVAVDDLFAPEFRGGDLWQRIHEAAVHLPPVVLITCGPNDYLEAFEQQENRHEIFEIRRVDLPSLTSSEQARYRTWYETRTGQVVIREVQAVNFVVASFLLERQRLGWLRQLGERWRRDHPRHPGRRAVWSALGPRRRLW